MERTELESKRKVLQLLLGLAIIFWWYLTGFHIGLLILVILVMIWFEIGWLRDDFYGYYSEAKRRAEARKRRRRQR